MKKLLMLVAFGLAVNAQTLVTGTVTSQDGVTLNGSTYLINLVDANGNPLYLGSNPYSGPRSYSGNLDGTGSLSVMLTPNASIVAGSQWSFTILPYKRTDVVGFKSGVPSFTVDVVISGSSQSISTQLSAAAPSVLLSGAGFSSGGLSASTANTFTAIQSFAAGISTSSITSTSPYNGFIDLKCTGTASTDTLSSGDVRVEQNCPVGSPYRLYLPSAPAAGVLTCTLDINGNCDTSFAPAASPSNISNNVTLVNNGTATSSTNYGSFQLLFEGSYYNSSGAVVTCTIGLVNDMTSGTSPQATLTLVNSCPAGLMQLQTGLQISGDFSVTNGHTIYASGGFQANQYWTGIQFLMPQGAATAATIGTSCANIGAFQWSMDGKERWCNASGVWQLPLTN